MNERPITLTEYEKMWLKAELLTFASNYHQAKMNGGIFAGTTFRADDEATTSVDWFETVVLSGKSIDDPEFQGA